MVIPHKHRGKAALCTVGFSERTGRFEFEFQRQKYQFLDAEAHGYEQEKGDVVGLGEDNGAVRVLVSF